MMTQPEPGSVRALMEECHDLGRRAGELLMKRFGHLRSGDIDFKGRRDLMTVADREAEDLIVHAIRARHPDHAILAEEAAAGDGIARVDAGWQWIVDPLDGTTNFVHELPFFCVSIAVFEDGEPVASCIHAPRLGETFVAGRGEGAFLNARAIRVSAQTELIDSLLATGFAYRVDQLEEDNLDHFRRLVTRTRALRRCGSAALDMAYTACGRFDGFWELHLSPWDVAAGALIVREAGGLVTDMDGGADWLHGGSIAAGGRAIHALMLEELRAAR